MLLFSTLPPAVLIRLPNTPALSAQVMFLIVWPTETPPLRIATTALQCGAMLQPLVRAITEIPPAPAENGRVLRERLRAAHAGADTMIAI